MKALGALIVALIISATAVGDLNFFEAVNEERSAVGLTEYDWNEDMAFYAGVHNEEMVAADKIYHSDATQLGQFLGVRVAENVGRGGTVESLMLAFMDSPGHRDAILDMNYTEIGVASLQTDTYLYVTMVFREAVTEETSPPPVEVRPPLPDSFVPYSPAPTALAALASAAPHVHEETFEHVTLEMIPPHFVEGVDRC